MMLGSACSGECWLCARGRGCLAGHGDDYFSPASKEQIIDRLEKGEYPNYTKMMKEHLKTRYGYNYDNNEREDGNMSKQFTKKDLKVGYVVKLRDGELRMVMETRNDGTVLVKNDGWFLALDRYSDGLTHKRDADGCWTIMEVYGYRGHGGDACDITVIGRELLWKREPEKTCDSCAHKVVCTHVGMCEHYLEKEV